jgi:helicase
MLGRRVAELFLDPLTADAMIKALKSRPAASDSAYMFMVCDSFELFPYLSIPKKSEAGLFSEFTEKQKDLLADENKMYLDTQYLNKFFLSRVFLEWINETDDEMFLKDFNVQPGILRSKLERADWLLYAAGELAGLIHAKKHLPCLARLRIRMKYGVREELLALVQLKHIGRVRARKLFSKGIKSVSDLQKKSLEELSAILPPKIALSVRQQIGLDREVKASKLSDLVSRQKKLN